MLPEERDEPPCSLYGTGNLMTSRDISMCMKLNHRPQMRWGLGIICGICLFLMISGVSALPQEERVPTIISIALDPAHPQIGQPFYITGTLISSTGEPLGNKWITLESTAAGATPGKFQYLKVTRTERDGSYMFFRPAASPPEDLQVRFKGLYPYAASVSDVVTAKK
ncbi:hypothetical protein [Methanospirillum hungatei]|nr:hypothetical protein [Methanospirillum hungatei]